MANNTISEGLSLAGKSCIITGAASGIGEAVARLYAKNGAKVAMIDFDRPRLEQVSAEIKAEGGTVLPIFADVTEEDTVRAFFKQVNDDALQPYLKGAIKQDVAMDRALKPMREFMFRQTRQKDLALFVYLSKSPRPAGPQDVPSLVLIPAFVLSELKTAFQMGFLIYIPFLIIDMVVASTLMSMGMLMLPPVTISLPFKILLFVLIDGWHLIVRSLMTSFN